MIPSVETPVGNARSTYPEKKGNDRIGNIARFESVHRREAPLQRMPLSVQRLLAMLLTPLGPKMDALFPFHSLRQSLLSHFFFLRGFSLRISLQQTRDPCEEMRNPSHEDFNNMQEVTETQFEAATTPQKRSLFIITFPVQTRTSGIRRAILFGNEYRPL